MRIAVGFDSRNTRQEIKEALFETFLQERFSVLDVGLAATLAMFMAAQYEETNTQVGIKILASYLPYYYNGVEFFTKEGIPEYEDMKKETPFKKL